MERLSPVGDAHRPRAHRATVAYTALRHTVERRARSSLTADVVRTYLRAGGQNWAAAIALNILLALFPIFLLILFVASLALQSRGARTGLDHLLSDLLPGGGDGRRQLFLALTATRHSTGILGILSLIGLIYTGSGLFGCMETALCVVHRC